VNQLIYRLKWG